MREGLEPLHYSTLPPAVFHVYLHPDDMDRLRGILPPDLQPNIDTLTHRQLVALRFASDAEMADLVRDVLAGKLASGKEIKMRVRNWQSDWLRA